MPPWESIVLMCVVVASLVLIAGILWHEESRTARLCGTFVILTDFLLIGAFIAFSLPLLHS